MFVLCSIHQIIHYTSFIENNQVLLKRTPNKGVYKESISVIVITELFVNNALSTLWSMGVA